MKSTRNLFIFCGIIIAITIIIVLYPKPSTTSANVTATNETVSPAQLNDWLKNKDFALVNLEVNDKIYLKNTDYETPYNEYTGIENYLKKDVNRKVVFYSKDGTQSAITVTELRKRGYKNSYYLVAEWLVG